MVAERNKKQHEGLCKAFEAEKDVVDLLRQHHAVIKVFTGIRVTDPDRKMGAGEIDAIALTNKGVFCIEVKRWKGQIIEKDGDIFQEKLLKDGKDKPVIGLIKRKSGHLRRYLSCKTNNPELDIRPLVVLASKGGKPTKTVLEMRHVSTMGNLHDKIDLLMEDSGHICETELKPIEDRIQLFGGFDKILFDGGKEIQGDFQKTPIGWPREEFKSISITIKGSLFSTLLRGPKLLIETHRWNGPSEVQIIKPEINHVFKIKQPWRKKVDSIQLQFIKEVSFGNQGQQEEIIGNTTSISIFDSSNSNEDSKRDKLKIHNSSLFSKGDVLENRTVLKHLQDHNGNTYGLLIELVPKKTTGLLPITHLSDLHPVMVDAFYGEGKGVDVKIMKIKANEEIELGLPNIKQ